MASVQEILLAILFLHITHCFYTVHSPHCTHPTLYTPTLYTPTLYTPHTVHTPHCTHHIQGVLKYVCNIHSMVKSYANSCTHCYVICWCSAGPLSHFTLTTSRGMDDTCKTHKRPSSIISTLLSAFPFCLQSLTERASPLLFSDQQSGRSGWVLYLHGECACLKTTTMGSIGMCCSLLHLSSPACSLKLIVRLPKNLFHVSLSLSHQQSAQMGWVSCMAGWRV